MTDYEMIKLVHMSLPDLQFSYIRDNEIYLKTSKNIRFSISRIFQNDITIRAWGRTINVTDAQILVAGFAAKEPFEAFSWDFDIEGMEDQRWSDISSEEDFFQNSLVLNFGPMSYDFFQMIMEIKEAIQYFVANDDDTCYRVHKYQWNKRKTR